MIGMLSFVASVMERHPPSPAPVRPYAPAGASNTTKYRSPRRSASIPAVSAVLVTSGPVHHPALCNST